MNLLDSFILKHTEQEKLNKAEQQPVASETHRASTLASSPSTPTTACGVFASITCPGG